jgi:MSHA biogenesis protein MshM
MYYTYFGLKQPPFRITPDTDFFYEGGNRGAVLEALIYAITQGEGIVKVTGEVGSGKTMLCRVLQSRLPKSVETVYLANPSVSPEEILHAIAFELQLPLPRDAGRLEVMHTLNEYLLARHTEGRQVVVFVEESQSMPIPTLEEIRLLSNLETRQHKLLQIVLFGQPELDENLRKPEIRQLRERITHSFGLTPLTAEEVRDYLTFRLRAAGYHGPDLFPSRLTGYMARATGGLNRRINIVADKALLAAFADNTHNVTLKHVKAAVQDSEFSSPLRTQSRRSGATSATLATIAAIVVLLAIAATGGVAAYRYLQRTQPPTPSAPTAAQVQSAPVPTTPIPASSPAQVNNAGTAPVTAVVVDEAAKQSEIPHQGPAAQPSVARAQAPEPGVGVAATGPSPADNLLEQRLLATGRWLAEERGGIYSIQLLGSNDPQMLRTYLETLSNYIEIDKIFVYRTTANREPIMTVLYGAFAGRAEAIKSLDALPAELKANRPYIRTVQGIRSELGLNKSS